jgi:hypothetical protein
VNSITRALFALRRDQLLMLVVMIGFGIYLMTAGHVAGGIVVVVAISIAASATARARLKR